MAPSKSSKQRIPRTKSSRSEKFRSDVADDGSDEINFIHDPSLPQNSQRCRELDIAWPQQQKRTHSIGKISTATKTAGDRCKRQTARSVSCCNESFQQDNVYQSPTNDHHGVGKVCQHQSSSEVTDNYEKSNQEGQVVLHLQPEVMSHASQISYRHRRHRSLDRLQQVSSSMAEHAKLEKTSKGSKSDKLPLQIKEDLFALWLKEKNQKERLQKTQTVKEEMAGILFDQKDSKCIIERFGRQATTTLSDRREMRELRSQMASGSLSNKHAAGRS